MNPRAFEALQQALVTTFQQKNETALTRYMQIAIEQGAVMTFVEDLGRQTSGGVTPLPAVSVNRNAFHIHNVYKKVPKQPSENFLQKLPISNSQRQGRFENYETLPKFQVVLARYQSTPSARQNEGKNVTFFLSPRLDLKANLPLFYNEKNSELTLTTSAVQNGTAAFYATGTVEQLPSDGVQPLPANDPGFSTYSSAARASSDALLQQMNFNYRTQEGYVLDKSTDLFLVVPIYPSVNAEDTFRPELDQLDPDRPNIHPFDVRYPALQPVLVGNILFDQNDKNAFYVDTILRGNEVKYCSDWVRVPFASFCLVYQLTDGDGKVVNKDDLFQKQFFKGNPGVKDSHVKFYSDVLYQLGQVLRANAQEQINTNGAESLSRAEDVVQALYNEYVRRFNAPAETSGYGYLIPELARQQVVGQSAVPFKPPTRGDRPKFDPTNPPPPPRGGTDPSEQSQMTVEQARRPIYNILLEARNGINEFYVRELGNDNTIARNAFFNLVQEVSNNLGTVPFPNFGKEPARQLYNVLQEVASMSSSSTSMTTAQDLRMREALALYSNEIPTKTMQSYKANELMGNFAKFPDSGYKDRLSDTMTQVQELQGPGTPGGEIRAPFMLRLEVFTGRDSEPSVFTLDSRTGLKSKYFEEGENVRYAIHYAKIGEDRKQISSALPLYPYQTITKIRATFSAGRKKIFKRSFKTDKSEQPAVRFDQLNDFVLQANAMNTYEPVRGGARQDTMTLLLKESFVGVVNSVTNLESVALLHKISFFG